MYTPSLQTLINQYGAKFGISPPAKTPATAVPPADTTTSSAPAPATPTPGARTTDHVTLSAQALEYQKAHTLASGKFHSPDLFGDFLGALDPTSESADGSDASAPSSLLDILNSKNADGSTAQNPASPNDPTKPFNTLSSFL